MTRPPSRGRLWLSPALACLILGPFVLTVRLLLLGRFDFGYHHLGWLRQSHPSLNDAYVVVMTERFSFVDRVMLHYYEIPKATQTPTSWTARPFTPDAALVAKGVRLAETAQLVDTPRIVERARNGGGSNWTIHRSFVALWLLNIILSFVLIASFVWLVIFSVRRRRAIRMMARSRLGLCPSCEYGLGGVETERCPECGGELRAIERSAQCTIRRGWFCRAWPHRHTAAAGLSLRPSRSAPRPARIGLRPRS